MKADSYSQIHIHVTFSVRKKKKLIDKSWNDLLYKYITGIIQNKHHKVFAINGMEDHLHMLIGLRPYQALSELIKIVKVESANWINEEVKLKEHFSWQDGYGAFSCSKSHMSSAAKYIQRQEEHHENVSFEDEYESMLKRAGISYKKEYMLG